MSGSEIQYSKRKNINDILQEIKDKSENSNHSSGEKNNNSDKSNRIIIEGNSSHMLSLGNPESGMSFLSQFAKGDVRVKKDKLKKNPKNNLSGSLDDFVSHSLEEAEFQ